MAKGKRNGHFKVYKSYVFHDKDPAIDELRTIAQDEYGAVSYGQLRVMMESGGPSVSCMAGWFFGDTRRPQSATLEAAGRSIGYRRTWVKMEKTKRRIVR